jgi:hypothetical protein
LSSTYAFQIRSLPALLQWLNRCKRGGAVNSLLSSYEALPGGSNPQRKECEAAINYNTPFTVTPGGPGVPGSSLKFLLPRRPYVRDKPRIGGAIVLVVASPVAEGEVAVDGSPDYIGVAVILPVVLPPANLA